MSDFLDGLERDLVEAVRRHEARPEIARRLSLPTRVAWPRVAAVAAAVALVALVAVTGVPSIIGGGGGGEVAVRVPLLTGGTYERSGYQLIVGGDRYSLIRCNGSDCGFDSFQNEVKGANRVRNGVLSISGNRAVFTQDQTCLSGGLDHGGTYRLRQSGRALVIELVNDVCTSRAQALRGAWTLRR